MEHVKDEATCYVLKKRQKSQALAWRINMCFTKKEGSCETNVLDTYHLGCGPM